MIRRPAFRALAVLFGLFLVATACGSTATEDTATQETAAASTAEAEVASPLIGEFTTISGEQIDLGSLEGEDVVLWFWAPW